ncbi:MAG: ROK family protein [Betaproteobacteria bacterium]|nr:ROK family protein [Betaproteobacteria bacterium]
MRIGVDLGGTEIEIIALDERGHELLRRRVATPGADYRGTLAAIAGLVRDAESSLGTPASIGIGTPGTLSRATGLLKNSNSAVLNGKPLRDDLEAMLGVPVRMANDANCFALSEAIDGAGALAHVVFGVILGTGVGGGIVVGGRALVGPNGIAGEWGHNPVPWPAPHEMLGPPCYCGKSGCIETYLSGPGMSLDHRNACGQTLPPAVIARQAAAGDAACEMTLQRYEDRLARALAQVVNVLDPDVIVLGGGLSNLDRWYETVPRLWGAYVFSDRVDTKLVRNRHGDSSGVRGAAWLWGDQGMLAGP